MTAFRNEAYTQDVSFEDYLRELADPAREPAVSKLTNLCAMRAGQASLFMSAWRELALALRQRLLQELIDLVEDSVELDFDAVFFIALADRDAGVRLSAIRGLWEYEERDLIDALLGLLRADPDAAVRAEAALALGRYVLQAEFETLAPSDGERVEQALAGVVRDPAQVAEVRGRALESLGARSAGWVRELIAESYGSTERRLRLSAAHAMGRSCDAAWLPELTTELSSDDAEMRFEAATALGAIGDDGAISHLAALLDDEDVEVQEAAIGALGQIGGERAKDALRGLLNGSDERVRESALAALAEIDFAQDPLGYTIRG